MRDEWFHDEVEPVSKDGKIGLAGVWIALDDEFAGLRGGNERKKKSFISRRHEKYRSPYDKWDQRHARQCVLAAAVNEEEILSDPTGGRRYWIIDVRRFDIEALVAEREQLWAEAVHRYRAREKWYLDDQKLVAAAARTQEAARARDAWEQPVAKWLGKKIGDGVTTHDVLRHCIFAGEEHMAHTRCATRNSESPTCCERSGGRSAMRRGIDGDTCATGCASGCSSRAASVRSAPRGASRERREVKRERRMDTLDTLSESQRKRGVHPWTAPWTPLDTQRTAPMGPASRRTRPLSTRSLRRR